MTKIFKILLFTLGIATLQSCCRSGDCDETDDFPGTMVVSAYEPVYMERPAFETSVELSAPKPVLNAGKIYVQGSYLFINEKNEGFHVFNNSDPSNPLPIHFLASPGATDLAIRENVFFINQATDLIAVQVDLEGGNLTVSKRIKETFPVMLSPDGFFPYELPENNVIVNWIPKTNTP
ncbi:hypothetical protein [Aequorivita flava]|uniref:LVIVD repeat-containing protein n=1 Tax=Aequorivita flava TaxID=3114371 RepID=A0AB35YV85_9FLAO